MLQYNPAVGCLPCLMESVSICTLFAQLHILDSNAPCNGIFALETGLRI